MEELVSNPEYIEKILTAILFCFDQNKKDPQKSNMLYICVFILLTLSSSREFALHLNEPYILKLPFDIPDFTATSFANLTIQVIYRSIQVGPRILSPLYKSLVSIISNITPYSKNLTKESSEAILQLVKRFSNIAFLKESENNCRILSNVFEAINYTLQYHDEGNEEFLVSLIKYREVFSFIDTLKLSEEEPIDEPREAAPELKTEGSVENLEQEADEKKEGEGKEAESEAKPEAKPEAQPEAQPAMKPIEKPAEPADGEMVNIPLDQAETDEQQAEVPEEVQASVFLSPAWEVKWKTALNMPNIQQAIKYTDDKARNFLQMNPSADNHIDADKVNLSFSFLVRRILTEIISQRTSPKPR